MPVAYNSELRDDGTKPLELQMDLLHYLILSVWAQGQVRKLAVWASYEDLFLY